MSDTTTHRHRAEISGDAKVPLVRIVREFDAPPSKVFGAHADRSCSPGGTDLVVPRLVDSFEARDAFVASGMESGMQDGYERLDEVLVA